MQVHCVGVCFMFCACARRCDCPNHKAENASWPGAPALPAEAFLDDYRVRMAGQFLVARPQDGVLGETAVLFPAASDYHLLCLQHDDSAQMIVGGARPAPSGFWQTLPPRLTCTRCGTAAP